MLAVSEIYRLKGTLLQIWFLLLTPYQGKGIKVSRWGFLFLTPYQGKGIRVSGYLVGNLCPKIIRYHATNSTAGLVKASLPQIFRLMGSLLNMWFLFLTLCHGKFNKGIYVIHTTNSTDDLINACCI